MGLNIMLIVFAFYENYMIQCRACSVLPGGIPPCFPDTKLSEKYKEITYELPDDKEFTYDLVSTNGLVRLGKPWEVNTGNSSDTVTCERDTSDGSYLEEFQTKLKWHGIYDDDYKEVDVNYYFVITKRKVWNCSGEESTQTPSLHFLRIVTELVATASLKKLSFRDGIQVTFVPHQKMPKQEPEGQFIPIVREVKYLHPQDYKVLKYEGYLKLNQPKKEDEEKCSIFKEINKENDAVFREIKLSSDAYLELIDRALPTNSDELATCKLNANDPNLYSAAYLTPWLVKNDVKASPTEPVDELNEIRCRNNFIITKHELWNCETRGSKKKLVRSILEYIGREPVKTLRYTNHLNLWTFVLNLEKQLQSIAVRDVSYFNEKLERVSYYGQIQEDKAKYKDVKDKGPLSKMLPSSSKEKSNKLPQRSIVNI
ncbi:uncharacterized protein LOC111050342 isoform X1 [Nilaparvata lugens]|uniref:uncharacterized protein LOC111050342 isoform X1 n=1 Tax=Nilaparvata lugens TaxID=108931 RepID=UPI00193CF201|nr:uncharacterized protein LOC111050342 isoform X1 [Nilaparvata lugens]